METASGSVKLEAVARVWVSRELRILSRFQSNRREEKKNKGSSALRVAYNWQCFFLCIVRWETQRTHSTAITIVFHYCLLLPRGHGLARGAPTWNVAIHSLVLVVRFLRVRVKFKRKFASVSMDANDISWCGRTDGRTVYDPWAFYCFSQQCQHTMWNVFRFGLAWNGKIWFVVQINTNIVNCEWKRRMDGLFGVFRFSQREW